MFRLSRSNKNIIRKAVNSNNNYDSYVSKLRSYFLPERVRNYWIIYLTMLSFQLMYLHLKIFWNLFKKNV